MTKADERFRIPGLAEMVERFVVDAPLAPAELRILAWCRDLIEDPEQVIVEPLVRSRFVNRLAKTIDPPISVAGRTWLLCLGCVPSEEHPNVWLSVPGAEEHDKLRVPPRICPVDIVLSEVHQAHLLADLGVPVPQLETRQALIASVEDRRRRLVAQLVSGGHLREDAEVTAKTLLDLPGWKFCTIEVPVGINIETASSRIADGTFELPREVPNAKLFVFPSCYDLGTWSVNWRPPPHHLPGTLEISQESQARLSDMFGMEAKAATVAFHWQEKTRAEGSTAHRNTRRVQYEATLEAARALLKGDTGSNGETP